MAKKNNNSKNSKKTKNRIALEVVRNPNATQREIAHRMGVNDSTVSKYMPEVMDRLKKDPKVIQICEEELEIARLGRAVIKNKLQDSEEVSKTGMQAVSAVVKDSVSRYSLFAGDATDENGGLKSLEWILKEIQGISDVV